MKPQLRRSCIRSRRSESVFSKRKGSLLLELIVAVFVLALVVIPASQYVTNALRAGEKTQSSVRAFLLCEARMNEILSAGEASWQNGSGIFESSPELEWNFTMTASPIPQVQRASTIVRSRETGRLLAELVVFVPKPKLQKSSK